MKRNFACFIFLFILTGCASSGSLFSFAGFGPNDSTHALVNRVDEQSQKRQQGQLPAAQPDTYGYQQDRV